MDNIVVSVIIPVFNCSQYIGSTLKSVINQDFENYEIIVIDDGSTDDSLDIINSTLNDCSISHKVIHQENAGVSVARNRGIEESSGDYLVFVDGDDYILENHLSLLYDGIGDFSLTQFAKKHEGNLHNPNNFNMDSISTEDLIKKELNMEVLLNLFQFMFKADIIEDNNIRFTPGIVYGEDIEFCLKALIYSNEVKIVNDVTYHYVQRSDSAIRTSEFKRFDIVSVFEGIADYYRINGKDNLADLIISTRIPKAIFGNMNYFFYNNYDFDDVIEEMKQRDLFSKLKKFKGDKKFKLKIKLFLSNPKLYYKMWFKFKKSID